MKISRNTFCELVVVLAVAGCGGGGSKGTLATSGLGEFVTLTGQVQGWNGLTGTATAVVDGATKGVDGNVGTDGKFAVPLPSGVEIGFAANTMSFCPLPPMSVGQLGILTALEFPLPSNPNPLTIVEEDIVVPDQHVRTIRYVYVDKEVVVVTSGDPTVRCAIDFLPGWNSYVDELDMTAGAPFVHNEYTGPIPTGAQWVVQ